MSETSPGISRRTLVKGTAWAVPAVAVASAAPAMALSGGGPSLTILQACKQPGASCEKDYGFLKGYTFLVRVTNPTSQPLYIYTSSTPPPAPNAALVPFFYVTSSVLFTYASARLFTPPSTIGAALNASQLIRANSSLLIIINAGTNSNSANTDAVGSLWFPWGHTATIGADQDHPYSPAPGNPMPSMVGEGWAGGSFNFASTPPCKDCFPQEGTTTTTTTAAPAAAAREAAPAEPQALVESDAPVEQVAAPVEQAAAPAAEPAPALVEPAPALVEPAAAPVVEPAPALVEPAAAPVAPAAS